MNNCFDFSGMQAFWRVFDILRSDKEPLDKDWEELFTTPGYNTLMENEFRRDFLTEKFRLSYMPSLTTELAKAMGEDKYGFLSHYLEVAQKREILIDHERQLESHNFDKTLDLCLKWLPINEVNNYPPVSFVIFHNDARGYSPVVIDLLASIKLWDFMQLLLAHESHHYYRNQRLVHDYEQSPATQKEFLRVFNQIEAEGIADCIDKAALIGVKHPFVQGFEEKVSQAPNYLELLDNALVSLAKGEATIQEAGETLNSRLPQSGHPVGFYMAQAILEGEERDAMVDSVGDCFAFFDLYIRTVQRKQLDRYKFSEQSVESLRIIGESIRK